MKATIEYAVIRDTRIWVRWSDGYRCLLFDFTPDKPPFKADELIGMTFDQAVEYKKKHNEER
ncbi:MAG: hypothetical protein GX459_11965 [Bacteroidales bacterium]|nr:hypothetical protein [Bacteroidales bacterium]